MSVHASPCIHNGPIIRDGGTRAALFHSRLSFEIRAVALQIFIKWCRCLVRESPISNPIVT